MQLVRFPPGEVLLSGRPFSEGLFAEVDLLLAQGRCPDGRLELEAQDKRLTCLLHRSQTYLAGLQDKEQFNPVPLRDFPVRSRQLLGARCVLFRTDPIQVLLTAVHFRHRPVLQATTELLDLAHVLEVLQREGQDAVMALERSSCRTLLFLQKGIPARIFFGEPRDDPGEGNPKERFLLHVYSPAAPIGRVDVYKKLNIEPDPDAGSSLVRLAEAARPCPPTILVVQLGGRVVLQRPFMPPTMTVGRDHACELLLDNLSVSRHHARLSWDKGEFVIEDLGSANGTNLNSRKLESNARTVLHLEDRIGLGKFEIHMAQPPEAISPDATILIAPKTAEAPAYLVGERVSVPLGQEITMGKAPSADVQARGLLVRPIHARIRQEAAGVYRIICAGKGHILLNGRKVHSAFVRPGDEIGLGRSRYKVVLNLHGEITGA